MSSKAKDAPSRSSKHRADKKRSSSSSSQNRNKKPRVSSSSKREIKQDRQSQRRHADVVSEAKILWNKLRLKTNTTKERRALLDELVPLIRGKANEIALQHDAARVVQAVIQFGTEKERREILEELCSQPGSFVELCKSQYAHFTVLKVIKYCHNDEVCLKLTTKALKGSMPKLAVHAIASKVVESIFTTFTPRQKAVLKQEFYGSQFALFASDTLQQQDSVVPTLESNLAVVPDSKEKTILAVRNIVSKGMDKSLYGYSYFQEILAEYLGVAKPKEIRAMAASAADNVIHLLSTRAGTRAAAAFVAYGTAKDRKRIMKSLKGYTRTALLHHDAYLAILRLVQLTDDTVSIQKNLLNELLLSPEEEKDSEASSLLDIALSDCGSKLFLMLLVDEEVSPKSKVFDPYEQSVLTPNPTVEENGEDVPTSKKDATVRRKELVKHLREPLIDLCKRHTDELLISIPGSLVLREVHNAFKSKDVVSAIIGSCKISVRKSTETGDDDSQLSLFEDIHGHRTIKNLILSDASADDSELFSTELLSAFDSQLMDICTSNRGAFVVAALCETRATRDLALQNLDKRTLQQRLEKEKKSTAGFKALLAAMDGTNSK